MRAAERDVPASGWLSSLWDGKDRAFRLQEGVSAYFPGVQQLAAGPAVAFLRDKPFLGAAFMGGIGSSLSEQGKGGTSRNCLSLHWRQ